MKNLDSFITEKAKAKKKEQPLKRKQGEHDAAYLELMGKYKSARRQNKEKAQKYLDDANELKKSGKVSADAKLAAAYI